MALKVNTFEPMIRALLNQYVELDHLCHFSEWVARRSASETKKNVEEHLASPAAERNPVALGSSTRYSMPLVFKPSAHYVYHGEIESQNERVEHLTVELGARMQGQCLVLAFEAMETFLKESAAQFYWQERGRRALSLKMSQKARSTGKKGTPDWYQRRVDLLCRSNCKPLIKQLSKHLPGFASACTTNWLYVNLIELYDAVAFCRNAIVHAGGEIDTTKYPSQFAKEFIQEAMRDSVLTGKKVFLPIANVVDHAMQYLGAMAYALYVEMSTTCGMKLEIPKKWHAALPKQK